MGERTTATGTVVARGSAARRSSRRGPSLYELAEDWLTGRRGDGVLGIPALV